MHDLASVSGGQVGPRRQAHGDSGGDASSLPRLQGKVKSPSPGPRSSEFPSAAACCSCPGKSACRKYCNA